MDKWLKVDDIIFGKQISELNLADWVDKGIITAFDFEYRKPIDIKEYREIHSNIVKLRSLIDEKLILRNKEVRQQRWKFVLKWMNEVHSWDEEIVQLYKKHQEAAPEQKEQIWRNVKSLMEMKDKIEPLVLSNSQWVVFRTPFNITHVCDIITSIPAIFKEDDIVNIINQETKVQDKPVEEMDTPQKKKERNNLLKIIGALIQINYLSGNKGDCVKGSGEPNIKGIVDKILKQLDEHRFTHEGMEESTLKIKIKLALEEIATNKIPPP